VRISLREIGKKCGVFESTIEEIFGVPVDFSIRPQVTDSPVLINVTMRQCPGACATSIPSRLASLQYFNLATSPQPAGETPKDASRQCVCATHTTTP
jgi:hypothetical protein